MRRTLDANPTMPSISQCPECSTVHTGGHDEKACALMAEQREDRTAKAEHDEDNPEPFY